MNHAYKALALAALLSASAPLHAIAPPTAPPMAEDVELTGWLHVDDYTFDLTTVEVQVDGAVQYAPVSRTGRFNVTLPANTEALIRVEHPGHLPKEVVVDTHHARAGEAGRNKRHITFAVVLDPERHMGGQEYAGPVAGIGFDQHGGCVAISHTKKVVPARRGKPMVF